MPLGELSSEILCFDWMGWVGKKEQNIDQLPLFVWETLKREGEACNLPITPHFLKAGQIRENAFVFVFVFTFCIFLLLLFAHGEACLSSISPHFLQEQTGNSMFVFSSFKYLFNCPSCTTVGFHVGHGQKLFHCCMSMSTLVWEQHNYQQILYIQTGSAFGKQNEPNGLCACIFVIIQVFLNIWKTRKKVNLQK